jgi:HEXXH motif-containing protein
MAERISSSKRQDERRLFFSPSVGKDRPLDRILLAYHAFANVLIFYATISERGYRNTWMTNRAKGLRNDVEILQAHLTKAQGLSELGLAIFLPLKNTLAENLRHF